MNTLSGHKNLQAGNIERAREMFRELEERDVGRASEIARRTFFIRDRLSGVRG